MIRKDLYFIMKLWKQWLTFFILWTTPGLSSPFPMSGSGYDGMAVNV